MRKLAVLARNAGIGGIWAGGVYTPDYGDARSDVAGDTFGASLDRIGYRGAAKAGAVKLGAMFELHIEQGPILEAEGVQIGVVQGVQGDALVRIGAARHGSPYRINANEHAPERASGHGESDRGIDKIAKSHADAVGTIGFLRSTQLA